MEKVKYVVQNPLSTPGKVVGLLLLTLVAGGVLAATLRDGLTSQMTESDSSIPQNESLADKAILYGNWAADTSQLFVYDLKTQQEYVLATLPINVKKVTLLNQNEILFIDKTNELDHGTELAIYSLPNKQARTIYTADNEFGIDDYVISPDKTKIAVWEVRFTQESAFRNGDSRVYTTDTSTPNVKNLISTEIANAPVLYPLAITNTGEIFMDRFLPNDGAGWAYGMSVADFTGNQVTPLENMQAGTYGTQPELSSDGSTLVFGGYDGSLGDGNEEVQGFRRALLSANTVEILDTQTGERTKLPLPNDNTYSSVLWEPSGDIRLSILSKEVDNTGTFLYDISSQALVNVNPDLETNTHLIAAVSSDMSIVGKKNDTTSFLGNLGKEYEYPYSQIQLNTGNSVVNLPISTSLSQIIGVVNSGEINPRQLITTNVSAAQDQVQLRTFEVKPTLEQKRLEQQSEAEPPPQEEEEPEIVPTTCREVGIVQCNQIMGTNFPIDDAFKMTLSFTLFPPDSTERKFAKCVTAQMWEGAANRTCTDSPLYLYGPQGLEVDVSINTPTFNSNISGNGKYTFTLEKDGLFSSNDKTYESLSFDYQAQGHTRSPLSGSVVRKSDVEKTVEDFAKKLGLNTKETYDLKNDITSKISDPYAFISFYSQKTSKFILPITFNPQPDTYINYVFYVKNLKSPQDLGYTPKEPVFEKTPRIGEFVAVEVSVMRD